MVTGRTDKMVTTRTTSTTSAPNNGKMDKDTTDGRTALATTQERQTTKAMDMDKSRRNEERGAAGGHDSGTEEVQRKSGEYSKKLTCQIELMGEEKVTIMELLKCLRELCGGLMACRQLTARKYEVTMSGEAGMRRLLDGFKIGNTTVMAKELSNDELVVSFLGLPAYITDTEIIDKLTSWGVSAVSQIKRRMWPGTNIADGTRYVKVKFTEQVQSLPYSAKFMTATGPEYVRVIHDRQVKVCRLCIQPGHILRECPEFLCHVCGAQGHYAKECDMRTRVKRCEICHNQMENCMCNHSENDNLMNSASESEDGEMNEQEEGGMSETGASQCAAHTAVESSGGRSVSGARSAGDARPPSTTQEEAAGELASEQQKITSKKASSQGETSRERRNSMPEMQLEPPPSQCEAGGSPAVEIQSSDSEMDLLEVTQVRKRQNADWQQKKSKKSRNKKESNK